MTFKSLLLIAVVAAAGAACAQSPPPKPMTAPPPPMAQRKKPPAEEVARINKACGPYYETLCHGLVSHERMMCLRAHDAQISADCRDTLAHLSPHPPRPGE